MARDLVQGHPGREKLHFPRRSILVGMGNRHITELDNWWPAEIERPDPADALSFGSCSRCKVVGSSPIIANTAPENHAPNLQIYN
jgi:hypothetical protein